MMALYDRSGRIITDDNGYKVNDPRSSASLPSRVAAGPDVEVRISADLDALMGDMPPVSCGGFASIGGALMWLGIFLVLCVFSMFLPGHG
jgi:hypothetical protein